MSRFSRRLPCPRSLLVVRDDRLGDFMLAWPAFSLLRRALPDTRITALVPEYTAPLARLCMSLDDLLVVPRSARNRIEADLLAARLREARYDAVVSFFSHYETARAFRRAGIPVRVAPAVKLAQVFHTHRLRQNRSRSRKPEYLYNIDLAVYALSLWSVTPPDPLENPPYLNFPADLRAEHARRLRAHHRLGEQAILFAVHPGHGGSAHNLDIEGYARLARAIADAFPDVVLLVTSGPSHKEREHAQSLCRRLDGACVENRLHVSHEGLERFALDLSSVGAFLSGSTGPLHLAACLGIPTVGFFPEKRSANATRWRPPSRNGLHLAVTRPLAKEDDILLAPTPEDCSRICGFLGSHLRTAGPAGLLV